MQKHALFSLPLYRGHHAPTRTRAFTLVELMTVVAIIALLAGLMIAGYQSVRARSLATQTKGVMAVIGQAAEVYRDETGAYPRPTGNADDPYPNGSHISWYPTPEDDTWERQTLWWRMSTPMDQDTRARSRAAAEQAWHNADPLAAHPHLHFLWELQRLHIWGHYGLILTEDARMLDLASHITDEEAHAYAATGTGRGAINVEIYDAWGREVAEWDHPPDMPEWFESPNTHWSNYNTAWRKARSAPTLMGMVKIDLLRQRGLRVLERSEQAWMTIDVLEPTDIADGFRDGASVLDAWGQPLGYIYEEARTIAGKRFQVWFTTEFGSTLDTTGVGWGRNVLTDRDDDGEIDWRDFEVRPSTQVEREMKDLNEDGEITKEDWASRLYVAYPQSEISYLLISAGADQAYHRWEYRDENRDNVEFTGEQL